MNGKQYIFIGIANIQGYTVIQCANCIRTDAGGMGIKKKESKSKETFAVCFSAHTHTHTRAIIFYWPPSPTNTCSIPFHNNTLDPAMHIKSNESNLYLCAMKRKGRRLTANETFERTLTNNKFSCIIIFSYEFYNIIFKIMYVYISKLLSIDKT